MWNSDILSKISGIFANFIRSTHLNLELWWLQHLESVYPNLCEIRSYPCLWSLGCLWISNHLTTIPFNLNLNGMMVKWLDIHWHPTDVHPQILANHVEFWSLDQDLYFFAIYIGCTHINLDLWWRKDCLWLSTSDLHVIFLANHLES